jgi:hypothetical protein
MALDPLSAGVDLAQTVINKIWPDKSKEEAAQLAAAVAIVQGQMEVNKAEAASGSVFVGGWRPFVGWACGSALAYTYLLYPLLVWACTVWAPHIKPPVLGNNEMLYELLFGMLGMGALRTFEKIKGVAAT